MAKYYTMESDLRERMKAKGLDVLGVQYRTSGEHKGEYLITFYEDRQPQRPGQVQKKDRDIETRQYDALRPLFRRIERDGGGYYCADPLFIQWPDQREYYAITDADNHIINLGPYPLLSEDRGLIEDGYRFLKGKGPTDQRFRMVPLFSYYDLEAEDWTKPAPKPIIRPIGGKA